MLFCDDRKCARNRTDRKCQDVTAQPATSGRSNAPSAVMLSPSEGKGFTPDHISVCKVRKDRRRAALPRRPPVSRCNSQADRCVAAAAALDGGGTAGQGREKQRLTEERRPGGRKKNTARICLSSGTGLPADFKASRRGEAAPPLPQPGGRLRRDLDASCNSRKLH